MINQQYTVDKNRIKNLMDHVKVQVLRRKRNGGLITVAQSNPSVFTSFKFKEQYND